MDLFYFLRSPTVITISSASSSRFSSTADTPSLHCQTLKKYCFSKYPDHKKLTRVLALRAGVAGTYKTSSMALNNISKMPNNDDNLVFVAGATGRVGSRTVRELLKVGFRVRAAVRNTQRAEIPFQSMRQKKKDVGTSDVESLEIVMCDLEKQDQIQSALGNASIVICCIGASEKQVFDVTGPYRIDYLAAKNLIDAATVAKVNHFILLTSLGTNKFGFPSAILNLFWGVLIWKRKAEEALISSGLPYTIVRPGGMERPTDAYKETHNISLSKEDTLFGGQVSNLQVAELMALMAGNQKVSCCKIIEIIAETTAPLTPLEVLLSRIPSHQSEMSSTLESVNPITKTVQYQVSMAPSEEKNAQEVPVTSRPSSPYIAPPTSPSPVPPGNNKKEADTKLAIPKSNISDVGITSSGSHGDPSLDVSNHPEDVLPSTGNNDVTKSLPMDTVQIDHPPQATFNSPYYAYEDLKPPSSPSPTQS